MKEIGLDKNFDELVEDDIILLLAKINQAKRVDINTKEKIDYSEATKSDYRRCLKQFLKFIHGKTGERIIPIVSSIPYLATYLKNHPQFFKNKDSYLWLNINNGSYGRPMMYAGAVALIKRAFERASLNSKKINPHHFRHSRMTYLAGHLREKDLCEFAGWEIGSSQVGTYVRKGGNGLTESISKMYGIKKQEEFEPKTKPIKCQICNNLNEPNAKFCSQCAKPLTITQAVEIENENKKTAKLMMQIIQNPKLLKQFQEFLAKS